ncbi:MAG: PIN domain-containing protein [Bdellovibrionales bacterium]|nr:PIN domain-containing protein [Bdellovibrionales bacterium]
MNDRYFIDTNIFVYSFDNSNPDKRRIANEIIERGLRTASGVVSFQVIQEFLNVATRKFATPLTHSDSLVYMSMVLRPLCNIHSSIALYDAALELHHRFSISFYDSCIVAAARQSMCKVLYTEDLQHQMSFDELEVINPFLL